MDKKTTQKSLKIAIDVLMTVALLFLMAFQVTGSKYHEWIGAAMLILFIIHNVFNIKWYKNLFKGKYNAARILRVIVNLLTLITIIMTGYSGIVMSRYVFSWLPLGNDIMIARKMHLACSYWSFVFMSIHLGLHWSMVTSAFKGMNEYATWLMRIIAAILAFMGAYFFAKVNAFSYMFLRVEFAMLDYSKTAVYIIIQNLIMMIAWCYAGYYLNKGLIKKNKS